MMSLTLGVGQCQWPPRSPKMPHRCSTVYTSLFASVCRVGPEKVTDLEVCQCVPHLQPCLPQCPATGAKVCKITHLHAQYRYCTVTAVLSDQEERGTVCPTSTWAGKDRRWATKSHGRLDHQDVTWEKNDSRRNSRRVHDQPE